MASSSENYDDINVTPMVDLYLVLLLIFIIMTTAGVQGVKVDLPRASKSDAPKIDAPKMQAITVDAQGKILLNTLPVTLSELETKLKAMKAATPDVLVVVRGNGASQYQGVVDVLVAVGRAGITKVGMATEPPKK
jgi:biopolymer transport protein ExbD